METLVAAMLQDEGVRLPGYRRYELEAKAQAEGIEIALALASELERLAAA